MTQLDLFATDRREKGPPAEDRERVDNARARVLARLKDGPATNHELNGLAFRYGARIHELRRDGLVIDAEPKGQGVWVYTLKKGA
jgi:hypothetical protein